MINKLIVGTRSSNLAITQTNYVIKKLKEKNPSTEFIIKKIKTKGDILLNKDLTKILDKGFFVSEIQNELEKKTIDFAIHSLKDLPSEENNNLSSFTVTKREEPMDVLVIKKGLKYKKILQVSRDLDKIGDFAVASLLIHRAVSAINYMYYAQTGKNSKFSSDISKTNQSTVIFKIKYNF